MCGSTDDLEVLDPSRDEESLLKPFSSSINRGGLTHYWGGVGLQWTLRWREMDSNFQFRAGSAPFRRSERSEHGIWAQGAQWLTGAPIYPLSNEALLPERTGCRDRFGAG